MASRSSLPRPNAPDQHMDIPPLFSLPEDQQLIDMAFTSPNPNPTTPPNQVTPLAASGSRTDSVRRGRSFRDIFRPSRAGSDARASGSNSHNMFNFPPEFVPPSPARSSTKRKASSSARSGKSVNLSPRNHVVNPDNPVIRAEDLFGRDVLLQPDSDVVTLAISDDDEHSDDLMDFEQDLETVVRNRPHITHLERQELRAAMALTRHRSAKRQPDALQSSAAILFSCIDPPCDSEQQGRSSRFRYLPLGPATTASVKHGIISRDANLVIYPSYRQRLDSLASRTAYTSALWPCDPLPKEIFNCITDYLSRDDIKSMRLVNKEFETKVSDTLFKTSVVPFNTELYDMIDEDTRSKQAGLRSGSKGKARASSVNETGLNGGRGSLHWMNAKDDAEGKVYKGHGLRVFQGFGPHIQRFGMSFEVTEAQLARPPIKHELDHVESYHGAYDWPPHQYTRFANLAGLERTADDTLRMKAAFANLKKVKELGLSVDSGLGWLSGPDKSVRARIFERPSPVFGQSHATPDHQAQESRNLWSALQACHRSVGALGNARELTLTTKTLATPLAELPGLQGSRFADPSLWPAIDKRVIDGATTNSGPLEEPRQGVLYTTHGNREANQTYDKSALVPADLRKEQKEWLLETEWAQRAFLECYILAIIDNPLVVSTVKTLNIAKVSSSFLPILGRQSFWDALPGLTDVTIHVKPDWRVVERDDAGFAETRPKGAMEAVRLFHVCVLKDVICHRPNITKLNIGYASGGEHAEGTFARNNHILPTPLTTAESALSPATGLGLVFSGVEHLTLYNCWITPPVLQELVCNHRDKSLKKLTLDSVSLTAIPTTQTGAQVNHAQAQAIANMQAQLNNMPGLAAAQGLLGQPNNPNMQVPMPGQNAQQLHQQLQHHFAHVMAGHIQPANPPAAPWHWLPLNNNAQANAGVGGAPQPTVLGAGNANAAAANHAAATQPPVTPTHFTQSHRTGSWPDVLDKISPGPVFSDYIAKPMPWEDQPEPRPETKLRVLELKSCGYARLPNMPNTAFDRFIDHGADDYSMSHWFKARQVALGPAMLSSTDRCFGKIVQHIPHEELDAMLLTWSLTTGWADREKAEEAQYDGLMPGGTGRVSGTIYKGMPLHRSE